MAYKNGDDENKMSARRQFKLKKLELKNAAKIARAQNPRTTNVNISTPMGSFGVNRGPQQSTPMEEKEPVANPEEGKPTSSAKAKAAVMAALNKKKKGMS
jgi:hypothetical protein